MAFTIAMVVLLAQSEPMSRVFGPNHLHDLGKLMLAFVMLWAYFQFSQFLIIWSANLPGRDSVLPDAHRRRMEVGQRAADPRALRAAVPAPAEPRSEAEPAPLAVAGDLRDRDALRRPVLADGARAWTDGGCRCTG